jgi:hypothetical protein
MKKFKLKDSMNKYTQESIYSEKGFLAVDYLFGISALPIINVPEEDSEIFMNKYLNAKDNYPLCIKNGILYTSYCIGFKINNNYFGYDDASKSVTTCADKSSDIIVIADEVQDMYVPIYRKCTISYILQYCAESKKLVDIEFTSKDLSRILRYKWEDILKETYSKEYVSDKHQKEDAEQHQDENTDEDLSIEMKRTVLLMLSAINKDFDKVAFLDNKEIEKRYNNLSIEDKCKILIVGCQFMNRPDLANSINTFNDNMILNEFNAMVKEMKSKSGFIDLTSQPELTVPDIDITEPSNNPANQDGGTATESSASNKFNDGLKFNISNVDNRFIHDETDDDFNKEYEILKNVFKSIELKKSARKKLKNLIVNNAKGDKSKACLKVSVAMTTDINGRARYSLGLKNSNLKNILIITKDPLYNIIDQNTGKVKDGYDIKCTVTPKEYKTA